MSNYYIDKNKLLESLTKDDIIHICNQLGCADYKEDNQGNLCFSTALCHGGDSPYKLVYYEPTDNYSDRKYGLFKCYTCSDSYDVVELVIRAHRNQGKTLTYYKALHWLAQTCGKINSCLGSEVETTHIIDDFDWINRIKASRKKSKAIPMLKNINENILEIFCYIPHEEFLNSGISSSALSRFEVGYYGLTDQITIPHRDMNTGNLIGIRGRNLSSEDLAYAKYVPLQINGEFLSHQLGSVLYGAWITKDKIKESGKILIAEAEKSCMLGYTYFGEDSYVVATCGSGITLTQQKIILNELGVREVIYAPDKDYEGDNDTYAAELWWNKQLKKVAPFVPFCETYIMVDTKDLLGFKDSPFDNGKDVFLQLYEDKIRITADMIKDATTK